LSGASATFDCPSSKAARVCDNQGMADPADDAIAAAIRDAWAEAVYPGDDALAGSASCCGEYGYVATFFRGRHWRDVTLASLEEYEGPANACYAFMSGEAVRFYLPALMLLALDCPISGPRSEWEASMVDVAVWALNPPRYRPEVHALEKTISDTPVTSPESMPKMREWWDARMTPFSRDEKQAIVAFLERMHARHGFDEQAEALAHWRSA
jgi:hypothetical protein